MSHDLLHVDLEGEEADLDDLMADGLDGSLDERIPALIELLEHGTPVERYSAAYLLIAWDVPEALETLIRWAEQSDELPRQVGNRFTGGDASFGQLAESLGSGGKSPRAADTVRLRVAAGRALLQLVEDEDFERHLSVALGWNDLLRKSLVDETAAAAERAISALERGHEPGFDLWTQAAGLLYPLSKELDEDAAAFARRLIRQGRKDRRMLLELVDALGAGSGPATLEVLRELAGKAKLGDVREAAEAALARRTSVA